MSDVSQGPGWWIASDGKWYPPQEQSTTAPAPLAADVAPAPGYWRGTDGNWYPPQQTPGEAPKKKFYKRVWFWLLIVVVLGLGGCSAVLIGGGVAIDRAAHVQHTVVYAVTGTSPASNITYNTLQEGSGQNGESQVSNVALPWTKTISVSGLVTAFDVIASVGEGGGSVTCTIAEDGRQIATNTATGAFSSATCNSVGT